MKVILHSIEKGKAVCGAKKGMGYFDIKDFKLAMKFGIACKKCAKIITNKSITNATTPKQS